MTKFRMHHPRASVARFYLPRSMGGRGLMRVSRLCVRQETKLRSYFQNADSDLFVKVCQLYNGYTALDLRNQRGSELLSAQDLKEEWRTRELYGRFYGHLNSEPTEYMLRHNNVAKIVHLELQIKFWNIAEVLPYYNYQPPPLVEFNHVKIYWDVQMITDRRVVHNKPDILVLDQLEKRAYIIDIAVPSDENAQKTRGLQ
ncbi:uncharacterized protein LOC120351835 [Nilaparvata lugens]|uniref:uncharacterized protein LOC120351835 n=1 Tax=Nilaparvata lugens TaxID=108931 RepID=UPI00193CBD4F|nr:uncharacterized protein LOC120351835 [Nilaparvata lugens]